MSREHETIFFVARRSLWLSLFFRFFTENRGWTLPALFSILRDLRDLAFDVRALFRVWRHSWSILGRFLCKIQQPEERINGGGCESHCEGFWKLHD